MADIAIDSGHDSDPECSQSLSSSDTHSDNTTVPDMTDRVAVGQPHICNDGTTGTAQSWQSPAIVTAINVPVNIPLTTAKSPRNGPGLRMLQLPWGVHRELPAALSHLGESELRPGELVMRTLFNEFTLMAERKIDAVMAEPLEKPLAKTLQRGEDTEFDQLLSAFGCVAEHCLPSILRALCSWYERQMADSSHHEQKKFDFKQKSIISMVAGSAPEPVERTEAELQKEKRDLAVEFIFCLMLIEVLKQMPFHPGHEGLVQYIETIAFKHFKYREGMQSDPNAANVHMISDLYAEVIGALAQSRFHSVKTRFMNELKELRSREVSPHNTQAIISLLMGMKFFRVKMVPIEEFEASFQYMQECAQYFLEVKDKDIKHALAGLFVEILVPVAAAVKNEVNVPCVKNFVEMLYTQTLDASTKSKHRLALFPLVTCLLCVSQKQFFLQNWHYFLAMCLSHLKNRDPKMCRVALEALYRLLWVYMIRIKCESNSATQSRLQSIVNSLFPKGSKNVIPRDTPLNIFVKIIQFIAQERLDFAMREIVFELLSVGRPIKLILTPERMSIGLRAFLVVADSLQQKDGGEPPMPRSMGMLPSGNTVRRGRKPYINRVLTEEAARAIGMGAYFSHVRRTFVDILRALDTQCGRPLMMTQMQNAHKEADEMITGERKARIDLFRTCVAAVPRLLGPVSQKALPADTTMGAAELVELLSRLTVHMDEELRALAFQTLQTLVVDFGSWRPDVVCGFSYFLAKEVQDTLPHLVDNGLKMLWTLLCAWKNTVSGVGVNNGIANTNNKRDEEQHKKEHKYQLYEAGLVENVMQQVEALALVMLCNYRLTTRRISVQILKECKCLRGMSAEQIETSTTATISSCQSLRKQHLRNTSQGGDAASMTTCSALSGYGINLIDVIDACCPVVVEKCVSLLPMSEKTAMITASSMDLQWLADRNNSVWHVGFGEDGCTALSGKAGSTSGTLGGVVGGVYSFNVIDAWSVCLFGFLQTDRILTQCPGTVQHTWPIVFHRLQSLFTVIDPTPISDNRASLLRSAATLRKPPNERDAYMHLWKNYITFAFRVVPRIASTIVRCASPDLSLSSSPDSLSTDRSSEQTKCSTISSSLSITTVSATGTSTSGGSGSTVGSTLCSNYHLACSGNASPGALYKLIVPLVRCEASDVRDAAVYALGNINSEAFKDLLDELAPYFREAVDRKQENLRRRKRRDALRLQLVRILEYMGDMNTFFGQWTGSDMSSLVDFIDGVRHHLENGEPDKSIASVKELALHFAHFLRKLIKCFPLEPRHQILKKSLRQALFHLFSNWVGAFGISVDQYTTQTSLNAGAGGVGGLCTAGGCGNSGINSVGNSGMVGGNIASITSNQNQAVGGAGISGGPSLSTGGAANDAQQPTKKDLELQFVCLQAMSAVICDGPCCEVGGGPDLSSEDSLLYGWLDALLNSSDTRIQQLAQHSIILLLEANPDVGTLLDWVVDKCYTGRFPVADACFVALAAIFSAKEYPCDHYTAIINVTLMNTGCARPHVRDTALQLLQILDRRFFGTVVCMGGAHQFGGHSSGPFLRSSGNGTESTYETNTPMPPSCSGGASCTELDVLPPTLMGAETLDALLATTYNRSQTHLSTQLALLHPELTMPMFSEITYRFASARPDIRQLLLQYLLPWLHNMELVDPNVPPPNPQFYQLFATESGRNRREGWGSVEATEMVLNNVFHLTAKWGDQHAKEIEEVWATLCTSWPNNMKVIIRYLIIISGMSPIELLPYAKRVVLYLARQQPVRLLDEMMVELQTVETLNCLIERTETPPFYRLTVMRKTSSHSDTTNGGGTATTGGSGDAAGNETVSGNTVVATNATGGHNLIGGGSTITVAPITPPTPICTVGGFSDGQLAVDVGCRQPSSSSSSEKGTIHTKRHSGEDYGAATRHSVGASAMGQRDHTHHSKADDYDSDRATPDCIHTANTPGSCGVVPLAVPLCQPHPLPMPEYGGYFAPLTEYLPDSSQPPIAGFHRCNVGVMLICDVVVDGIELDWTVHVPLMLHIVFLGLDHTRPIVHQHCRQLLLNLLIVLAHHNDHFSVAHLLLTGKTSKMDLGLQPTQQAPLLRYNFTDTENQKTFEEELMCLLDANHAYHDHQNQEHTKLKMTSLTVSHLIKSLIAFLNHLPLSSLIWTYEDITAKVWHIKSAEQMSMFLSYVVRVFEFSLPSAHVGERWAQTALQLGLSCSSRHYAGRSLQVYRALRVPISSRMLSDILSRLVETVAEQGEDMQGYVTELLLTLESVVDALDAEFGPAPDSAARDMFKSTPNLLNNISGTTKKGAVGMGPPQSPSCSPAARFREHGRSTSYSAAMYAFRKQADEACAPSTMGNLQFQQRYTTLEANQTASCVSHSPSGSSVGSSLTRSRSAQSLKHLTDYCAKELEDKLNILTQLFWLAVCLLESDYEHEFVLAVRLLSRVMQRLPLDRPEARDKVDKLLAQLRWPLFPGVHSLLLKGCTHPNIYEPVVVQLLAQFTPLLNVPVMDASQSMAFPMNVIALLPYLLLHFEDANEICRVAAENIAQVSMEKGKKLENLGTVMNLYSKRTFSKESFQWTKCVVKYLYDTYAHLSEHMLLLLLEMLDKGATNLHLPILNVIHCIVHYVDLMAGVNEAVGVALLRTIVNHVSAADHNAGTPHWHEALKIIKLVVTRCSSLVAPSHHWDHWHFTHHAHSFGELPGRTMEFTFDVSQTPIIGRRFIKPQSLVHSGNHMATLPEDNANTVSAGGGAASSNKITDTTASVTANNQPPAGSAPTSPLVLNTAGWKRPWMCQARVRECLINLLTTCGQRVGLPKSPSVIFSQTSDIMDHQSTSITSSTEEVSGSVGALCGSGGNGSAANGSINSATVVSVASGANGSGLLSVVSNNNNSSMDSDNSNADNSSKSLEQMQISRTTAEEFGAFKDFDFLEYESESIEADSTDNFNWGVRRRPLSQSEDEGVTLTTMPSAMGMDRLEVGDKSSIVTLTDRQQSIEIKTTVDGGLVLQQEEAHKLLQLGDRLLIEESSDDDLASESPLDEMLIVVPDFGSSGPASLTDGMVSNVADSERQAVEQETDSIETISERGTEKDGGGEMLLSPVPPRSSSPSSTSTTSGPDPEDDDAEATGDATPCNEQLSARVAPPAILVAPATRRMSRADFLLDQWATFIQGHLLQTGTNTLRIFHQLQRLIKDACVSTIDISKEACSYMVQSSISGLPTIKLISSRFTSLMDLINHRILPYNVIWYNWSLVNSTKLIENLKYGMLEIQEHLETFCDKRDQVLMFCNAVKATLKLEMLQQHQQHTDAVATVEQEQHEQYLLDLGKSLYKLLFQLLLLIEASNKLVSILYAVLCETELRDITTEVMTVRNVLIRIMEDTEADGGVANASSADTGQPTGDNVGNVALQFYQLIENEDFSGGVALFQTHHDEMLQSFIFSNGANANYTDLYDVSNDVCTMVSIYCQQLIQHKPDCFVMTNERRDLADVFGRLFQVSAALSDLEGVLR